MDPSLTPKSMKKISRNPLKKMGKKLREFEESLGMSGSNGAIGSLVSVYEETEGEDPSEQQQQHAETASLRSASEYEFETPHVARRSKTSTHRYSGSSTSSGQWQQDAGESSPYDTEMRIVCENLMRNEFMNLYEWRAFDKKVALLRAAVSFSTSKVIGPVIIFLENTLSKPIFYELIGQYPAAVKSYLSLLNFRPDAEKQLSAFKQFGRNHDVAMIYLKESFQTPESHRKLDYLDQAAIAFASHPWWQRQIAEYQHLLRKQRELQSSLDLSRSKVQLENQTVLETYKSVYEIDFRRQKQNRMNSSSMVEQSQEIERAFRMSPELIMCGRLAVIMRCGLRMHYEDFFHQAVQQGLFGKKYIVAPEYLADMVYRWSQYSGESVENASERAGKFLNLINNAERRVYFAEKYLNYDIAIDTIVNVFRNRGQLESLRKRIPPSHPSYQRATYFLDTTKWKT